MHVAILVMQLISPFIFNCIIILIDPTLTVENAARVFLLTKGDWDGDLGIALLVPKNIREKIHEEHCDLDDQKRELIKYWLENVYNASWEILAGVLYYTQEEEALKECRIFLTPTQGLCKLPVYMFWIRNVYKHLHDIVPSKLWEFLLIVFVYILLLCGKLLFHFLYSIPHTPR